MIFTFFFCLFALLHFHAPTHTITAGALVAGTAAAGTGAAAAYQHAKNKEQRVLVLATETYGVAVAWQRALAQEVRE